MNYNLLVLHGKQGMGTHPLQQVDVTLIDTVTGERTIGRTDANGRVEIASDNDARIVVHSNLEVELVNLGAGGPGPFEYDYLIDAAYTAAAGRTFTTFHNHPFKVYATIAGAITDANANRQTSGQRSTFLIVPGTYQENGLAPNPPSLGGYHFYGGGRDATLIQSTGNGQNLFDYTAGTDERVSFHKIRFDLVSFSGAGVRNSSSTGSWLTVEDCYFALGHASALGISLTASGGPVLNVRDSLFIGTAGVGIQATGIHKHIIDCEFWLIDLGIDLNAVAGAICIGNYFNQCDVGLKFRGNATDSVIQVTGNHFQVSAGFTGIQFAASTIQSNIAITGNEFYAVNNGSFGIDFGVIGGGLAFGITMSGNSFSGTGTGIGIRGSVAGANTCIISGSSFRGFTSGNEITAWTGTGNESMHNVSVSGVGVKQALADIGSPVGHSSTALAAPNNAQYLVLALHADLTAERRFVAGTALTAVDGGANGDYTLSHASDATAIPDAHHAKAHVLLDGSAHTDTVAQTVSRGSLIYGNSTPKWDELVVGSAGSGLWTDGTDVSWTINPKYAGYLRVGSASAPVRTTAGDLTAERVFVGNKALAAANSLYLNYDGSNNPQIVFDDDGTGNLTRLIGTLSAEIQLYLLGTMQLHINSSSFVIKPAGTARITAASSTPHVTIAGNTSFTSGYIDIAQIAVPANPGAGTRRLFVDSATGEISVRTSAGTTVSLESGGGSSAHSGLTGLAAPADDHTQYMLLAGRAGGQTLVGGTAASESLTLQSTAHATKGLVAIDGRFQYKKGADLTVDGNGQITVTHPFHELVSATLERITAGADGQIVTLYLQVDCAVRNLDTGGGSASLILTSGVAGMSANENVTIPGGGTGTIITFQYSTSAGAWLLRSIPLVSGASTYLRVGSVTAPTNVTDGDLTCVRLKVGDAAFATGVEAHITGDLYTSGRTALGGTAATDATKVLYVAETFTVGGSPTAVADFGIHVVVRAIPVSNRITLSGLGFEAYAGESTANNTVQGIFGYAYKANSANTVTDVIGAQFGAGTEAGATGVVTRAAGLVIDNTARNSTTPVATTSWGIRILDFTDWGNSGARTCYGIQIDAMTTSTNPTRYAFWYGAVGAANHIFSIDHQGFTSIRQQTLGSEVLRVASISTNDDPTESWYQNRVPTTDATVTTLHSLAIPASTTVMVEAMVVARRTGGAAGTAEDGAAYTIVACVKNVAGTATIIGVVNALTLQESQVLWDATIDVSGATARVRVTGAVNNNVTWHVTLRVWQVST